MKDSAAWSSPEHPSIISPEVTGGIKQAASIITHAGANSHKQSIFLKGAVLSTQMYQAWWTNAMPFLQENLEKYGRWLKPNSDYLKWRHWFKIKDQIVAILLCSYPLLREESHQYWVRFWCKFMSVAPQCSHRRRNQKETNFNSKHKLHIADMGAFQGVKYTLFHAEPSNTSLWLGWCTV